METDRAKTITWVAWAAIVINAVLAVLKIVAGIIGGSLAVLGDGIDSTTDIVASGIILFAAKVISKPADREHPYGHFRAETIATKALSFIIFFAGAQLALSTIHRLINKEYGGIPDFAVMIAAAISIVGKIGLTVLLIRKGKRINSSMLIANGKNMLNDVLISGGVVVGVLFTRLLGIPIIDALMALAISAWIMKTAFGIFMESTVEVMDSIEDQSIYRVIFDAVDAVQGAVNPHRTRVRKLSNVFLIDLDIEVDGSMTVADSHRVAMKVEETIKDRVDNVYDIMVHIEPRGHVEKDERFGLDGRRDP